MDDFGWFDHWEIPRGPQRKQLAFCAQLTYFFGVLYLTEFVPTVYLPLPSCGIYQGCLFLLFLPSSSFFSFSFPLFPLLPFLLPLVFRHRYKHEHFPQAGFSPDSAFVLCIGITGVHYHACPGEGGCSLEALRVTSVSSPFTRFTLTHATPSKYFSFFSSLPHIATPPSRIPATTLKGGMGKVGGSQFTKETKLPVQFLC